MSADYKRKITNVCLMVRDRDYPWMNECQLDCLQMLSDLCGGVHHVGGIVRRSGSDGIEINLTYGFYASTFDYDGLTQAVFMAHDRCIRFAIAPSGPKMLKLSLHKRHTRDGDICHRHPTIETALDKYRENWWTE